MLTKYFKDNYTTLIKRIRARKMQKPDAEDVVQEAFYRATKYLPNFDKERGNFDQWFNTILNNSFKNYRHANFTGDYSFNEELDEEVIELEDSWVDDGTLGKIREEIEKLPNGQKSIVYLVMLNGVKYKEASQILDENVENIKKVVYRFRKLMKEKYSETS